MVGNIINNLDKSLSGKDITFRVPRGREHLGKIVFVEERRMWFILSNTKNMDGSSLRIEYREGYKYAFSIGDRDSYIQDALRRYNVCLVSTAAKYEVW